MQPQGPPRPPKQSQLKKATLAPDPAGSSLITLFLQPLYPAPGMLHASICPANTTCIKAHLNPAWCTMSSSHAGHQSVISGHTWQSHLWAHREQGLLSLPSALTKGLTHGGPMSVCVLQNTKQRTENSHGAQQSVGEGPCRGVQV